MGAGLLALSLAAGVRGDEPPAGLALAALRATLAQEQGWIKVHAAEVLAAQGETAAVHATFLQEFAAHGTELRYRHGIRRTLALTSATPAERATWIEPIAASVMDPASPDRLYALESLAKLGPPHAPAVQAAVAQWLVTAPVEEAVYLHWLQGQAGDPAAWTAVAAQLASPVLNSRLRAAFVLRRPGPRPCRPRARRGRRAGRLGRACHHRRCRLSPAGRTRPPRRLAGGPGPSGGRGRAS